MANKVLLKKSSVTSKVPLTTDLDYGELALNYADGKLYFKNSSNTITSFQSDLSSYVTLTGTQTLTNKTLTSPALNSATANNLTITGTLTSGGSAGTSGQYLQSTGTGTQWVTLSVPTSNYTLIAEFGVSSISAETSVYSFPIATYRTAKYIIQLTNGTAYNSLEVLVSHNGTNVWIATNSNSYATNDPAAGSYFDGNYINLALREGDIQIGTINAGIRFYISGGNLIFAAVANSGTVSVKGQVTLIKV